MMQAPFDISCRPYERRRNGSIVAKSPPERPINDRIRNYVVGLCSTINGKEPTMAVNPIPNGYHTVTPYLVVRGAAKMIEFAKKAFGADIVGEPMKRPDGTIMHAQIKIGDSHIMVSDASAQNQPMQSMLYIYVPNVDAVYQRAVAAGGASMMEPMDMFYGDRSGGVKDPTGTQWFIGTRKEDVAPQELKKRAEAHLKSQQGKAA
jgi:PhnB protein